MVKISEINRTSTFAWSLDSLPLLATGTVAGAVDIDFSSSATLEIWDIFSPTSKNEPLFSAPVENKFYALAWSKPFDGRSSGLLAGAFENGIVEFWDVATLIKTKDLAKSSVHKSSKHTGAVKSLQFNPIQPHVLVTGGSNGQIFVWDTKNFSEPFAPGQAMTPMDEISSVAWNNSVSHIFASTGNSGYTSIWDLKSKKEVLHLSYNGPGGRANFSHVAWHPTKSTQLVTASDNDSCPLILTWDLRNSNAPEKIIEGHKKGVLSLDWCKQDANLLISCGKDNATILWNPIEGKKLAEYPTTANWAFKSRFAPSAPDIFATASFDGKITVQTIQDTSPPVTSKVTASNNDNDFWNEISVTETQQPVFEVKQAPAWLRNPVSVSFGFGSKLVSVESVNGKSIVKIEKYLAGFKKEGTDFENLKNDKYESIIETRLNDDTVKGKNHADWEILETFSKKGKDEFFGNEDEKKENKIEGDKKSGNNDDSHKDAGINVDGDADFFEHLGNGKVKSSDDDYVPSGNFSIFRSNASDADKKLINLILSNRIEDAVESSLEQKKLVEALVLALDASEQVKQSVKAAYFKKHKEDSLARIIYNVSSKNVTDLVAHANVRDWKEIAKGIKAIAPDSEEYNDKMSELGDRILNANDGNRDDAITCYLAGGALDKLANLWLQELPEYESELLKSDATKVSSPSEARLHVLTNFVEKIATYKYLSKIDGAIAGPLVEPISKALLEFVNLVTGSGEFELAEKVLQLLPNELASVEKERILRATGKDVKTTSGTGVNKSSLRAISSEQKVPRQPSVAKSRTQYPSAPSAGLQQFQTPPAPTPQPTGFQYATPPMPQQAPTVFPQQGYPSSVPKSTNPYAKSNPYAPTNIYKAASPVSTPAALNPSGVTPPPPAGTSSAPKSNKLETDGWNDLPETFKPKTTAPRRAAAAAVATPAPVAVASPSVPPLPNHSSQTSFNSSFAPPKRTISTTGFAPPPKSSSRSASRTSIPTQQVPSPKPTPTTKYAPPPGTEQPSQAGIPNFGAPPTAATSPLTAKNPYAPTSEPAPAKVPFASPPPLAFGAQPTPPAMPPNNPYAPPPSVKNSSPQVPHVGAHEVSSRFGVAAPPQQPFGINLGTPAQSPFASVAPPPTGPARPPVSVKEQPPAASVSQPAPTPAKHPQGDRSHISDDLKPIYTSLTKVIEAIKPNIPEKFAKHGADMERRLNILFDHLNNDDLSKPLTESLKEVSSELENKKFAEAEAINVEIATNFTDELGNWHTGLKRLITMAGAMY